MAMAQPWHLSIVALDALTITKPGHHRAFLFGYNTGSTDQVGTVTPPYRRHSLGA